jgi:hypothetical protein
MYDNSKIKFKKFLNKIFFRTIAKKRTMPAGCGGIQL